MKVLASEANVDGALARICAAHQRWDNARHRLEASRVDLEFGGLPYKVDTQPSRGFVAALLAFAFPERIGTRRPEGW